MTSPSRDADLIRRLETLRSIGRADSSVTPSDEQLEARFAALTGGPSGAREYSNRASKHSTMVEKELTEDEMIDDLLNQAQESAKLEARSQFDFASSLEERLARLKAQSPAKTTLKEDLNQLSTVKEHERPLVLAQSKPKSTSSSVEFGLVDSGDEDDEELLNRVISAALDFTGSDDEV